MSTRQDVTRPVRSGRAYTAVKYVGVDTALTSLTSLTSRAPRAAARTAAHRAARRGWAALLRSHRDAWRALWDAGIEVPGHPDLQLWVRSAQYGLLSSPRAGARDSIAPTGLTGDNYAGMIFWDAETWMFPALLATRPELARPVLEYRYRTRAAAAENAARTAVKGLFHPWTSASHGRLWSECQSWQPPHCLTQNHLQGDIALAAWQYYLSTGDRRWLRERGWPLLDGLARYWTSRVTANTDGSYSVKEVAGPDEYSNGVTDGVYTNAVAATALRAAHDAARLLGRPHRRPGRQGGRRHGPAGLAEAAGVVGRRGLGGRAELAPGGRERGPVRAGERAGCGVRRRPTGRTEVTGSDLLSTTRVKVKPVDLPWPYGAASPQ